MSTQTRTIAIYLYLLQTIESSVFFYSGVLCKNVYRLLYIYSYINRAFINTTQHKNINGIENE